MRASWLAAFWLLVLGAGACHRASSQGCTKDTDCKGDRICEAGKCVSPGAAARPSGKDPSARTATPAAPGAPSPAPSPRAAPGGASPSPGAQGPTPSAPVLPRPPGLGPGGLGPGGLGQGLSGVQVTICLGKRCRTIDQNAGPSAISDLMDLLMQLSMGAGFGAPGPSARDLSIRICVRGRCTVLDKNAARDPSTILRLMSILSDLMMGGLGGGLFGPNWPPPGLPPAGRGRSPGTGRAPRPPAAAQPAGPIQGLQALRKAGEAAAGRVAEVRDLEITSVTRNRLVVQKEGVLIILKVRDPKLARQLSSKTGKIGVRFRVEAAVGNSLFRGLLLGIL